MVLSQKKQKDFLTISQLYDYFNSPYQKFRALFQKELSQLSKNPYEIAMQLARIRDEKLHTLENFSLILFHPSPFEIASGLIQLHHSKLLTPENKKAMEGHSSPSGIALLLRLLNSVNLLSETNRSAIQEKNDPHLLASVLFVLFYANLFTQKNFDDVLAHRNLSHLCKELRGFDRRNILTQTQLEQLIQSSQEKNSHDKSKLKKTSLSERLILNKSITCRANFFYVEKRQQNSESLCHCELNDSPNQKFK